MDIGGVTGTSVAADLTETMLGGELQMVDLAMKGAQVSMQMKLKTQEMAQTQAVVSMITGVGGTVNTVV